MTQNTTCTRAARNACGKLSSLSQGHSGTNRKANKARTMVHMRTPHNVAEGGSTHINICGGGLNDGNLAVLVARYIPSGFRLINKCGAQLTWPSLTLQDGPRSKSSYSDTGQEGSEEEVVLRADNNLFMRHSSARPDVKTKVLTTL